VRHAGRTTSCRERGKEIVRHAARKAGFLQSPPNA
jgi:hypothetical protein